VRVREVIMFVLLRTSTATFNPNNKHGPTGVEVEGIDKETDQQTAEAIVRRCDVLGFAVPIAATPAVSESYAALLPPDTPPPLWFDVTSLKVGWF
jgi:prephenate dehydrogenase